MAEVGESKEVRRGVCESVADRGRNERKVRRKLKRMALIYTYVCMRQKEKERVAESERKRDGERGKREMSLKRCVLFGVEATSVLRTGGT